jgi:hypothetical protein
VPAADVQYVLDGSLEAGHISGDTHFYLMEIATNSNELMDAHEAEDRDRPAAESHWANLARMGLYFESHYVDWRASHPAEARMASLQGLRHVPETFREFTQACSHKMAERGHRALTPAALDMLDKVFEFKTTTRVMRRTMARAAADFAGASPTELSDVRTLIENRYADNRRAHDEAMQRLQQNMHTQVNNFWVTVTNGTNATTNNWRAHVNGVSPENYHHNETQFKKTQKMLRERKADERRVLKRSIKFFSKLVGSDTTRVFIGGGGIRFEGKHAIYEMKKMSGMMNSHGGFRALSVYHKDHPDLMLCNLCIATDKVPLLDHVASLIMHIKSGNEEEILKIGNAREIHETARDYDWLEPHLPKPFDREGPLNWDHPRLFERDESPGYRRKRERIEAEAIRLRPIIARYLYDEVLADYMPLVRAAGLAIRSPEYQWATVQTVNATVGTNATMTIPSPFMGQAVPTPVDHRFCTHATTVELLNRPLVEPLVPGFEMQMGADWTPLPAAAETEWVDA